MLLIDFLLHDEFVVDTSIGGAHVEKVWQGMHITCIATIAMSGKSYPPYIIIREPPQKKAEFVLSDAPGPIILNSSGWVDQEIKKSFFEWLIPQLPSGNKIIVV